MIANVENVKNLLLSLKLLDNWVHTQADALEKNKGDNSKELQFINMVSWYIRINLEMIYFYVSQWEGKQIGDEEVRRCIELTKLLFINTVSLAEYVIREFYNLNVKIMLSRIIEKCIPEHDKKFWSFINNIRNDIVHNNGIVRENDKFSLNSREFILEQGKMTQIKENRLDDFVLIVEHLLIKVINILRSKPGIQ